MEQAAIGRSNQGLIYSVTGGAKPSGSGWQYYKKILVINYCQNGYTDFYQKLEISSICVVDGPILTMIKTSKKVPEMKSLCVIHKLQINDVSDI